MTETRKNQPRKILVTGLGNTGKSSIILSLQNIRDLSQFTQQEPTRGINQVPITNQDQIFSLWDVGGQNDNREDFLNNIEDKIMGTEKIIYVIDVKNQVKYDEAINYLKRIIAGLKKINLIIPISVFLHKFDPGYKLNASELNRLVTLIKSQFPPYFEYDIHKTTIFTVFKNTILIE